MRFLRTRTEPEAARRSRPAYTRCLLCAFAIFAALGCRTSKPTEPPLSTTGWRVIRSGHLAVKVPPGTTVPTSLYMVRGVSLSVEPYEPGQTWQSLVEDFKNGIPVKSSRRVRDKDAPTLFVLPTPAGQVCHRADGGHGMMGSITCILQLPQVYVYASLPVNAPDRMLAAEQTMQQVMSHVMPAPVRDGDFAIGNNETRAGVHLPPDPKTEEHADIVLAMLLPVPGTSRTSNMQVNLDADSPDPLRPHTSLLRDSVNESTAATLRGDPVDTIKRQGHRTVAGLPGDERVTVISAPEPGVSPMECRWQFFGNPNKPTPLDVTMRATSPAALNNYDYATNLRAWDAILDTVHLQ